MTGLIVTLTDCQQSGFCAPGIKSWCDAHGFDIRNILKNGIPADLLAATGDAFALRAVAAAERRASGERRR